MDSCAVLGTLYEEGGGGTVDKKLAYQYYKKACNAGKKYACKFIKTLDYSGKIEIYQNMCDKGNASMCTKLAMMYVRGEEVKFDYQKVFKLLKKACEMNDGLACAKLGFTYAQGTPYLKQDLSTAERYFKLSCDLKNDEGCEYYNTLTKK